MSLFSICRLLLYNFETIKIIIGAHTSEHFAQDKVRVCTTVYWEEHNDRITENVQNKWLAVKTKHND